PSESNILTAPTNRDGLKVLPSQFDRCEVNDLIELVASMLDRLITHNDQIPLNPTCLTRFHSRSPPSIPIKDYLDRIYRYAHVEPICLISILQHIDQICERLINFTICSLTVHRFSITSVTVSCKSICDSFYSNSRYAKVGGIALAEMNLLEREFLIAIDYNLKTSLEVLNRYYLSLVQSHPNYTLQSSSTYQINRSITTLA
ncbi:cyclin-domain-containing protein, partial [Phakopsora pachyrhizi]